MGFYLELFPVAGETEYREQAVPNVFWILYGLAGFALACMFGAAYSLLGDLAKAGSTFDRALIGSILSAVPIYVLLGVKMAWVRKFARYDARGVEVGHRLAGKTLWKRFVPWAEVKSVELVNQRPTANLAPRQHGDAQYYIRGHWRLLLVTRENKEVVLDRHTEKEMLEPLFTDLRSTLLGGGARS